MAIKNYSTNISVEKTVSEIESNLAKHGARKIQKDYYGDGSIKGIAFIVLVNDKQIPFVLPIELNAWVSLLNLVVNEGKMPKRFLNDSAQAARIGWRVIKDWVDAQLALVETKTVKIEQVFLPYAMDNSGKTLYDAISSNGWGNLQLVSSDKDDFEEGVVNG